MMNRYMCSGLAASVIAGAALVLPVAANAETSSSISGTCEGVVTVLVVPYQCVPVAGCATMVNVPPVKRTFLLRPFQCVNSAGCASHNGW